MIVVSAPSQDNRLRWDLIHKRDGAAVMLVGAIFVPLPVI